MNSLSQTNDYCLRGHWKTVLYHIFKRESFLHLNMQFLDSFKPKFSDFAASAFTHKPPINGPYIILIFAASFFLFITLLPDITSRLQSPHPSLLLLSPHHLPCVTVWLLLLSLQKRASLSGTTTKHGVGASSDSFVLNTFFKDKFYTQFDLLQWVSVGESLNCFAESSKQPVY